MGYVVAVSSGHLSETAFVAQGTIWRDDDPFVLENPHWFTADFESVPGFISGTQPNRTVPDIAGRDIEATTANPGEKRAAKRG